VIQLTPQMRIFLAVDPVDFRRGIDGLGAVCREVLQMDPLSGFLFVFANRRRTSVKILVYDGQGFWICQKRLSKGRFQWWPSSGEEPIAELEARKLQLVLWNGDPSLAKMGSLWRPLVGQRKG